MRRQCYNDPPIGVGYGRILAIMFCVGAYALLAQVLLLREFLVVFFGNELVIGAVFGVWLTLIGAGSFLSASFVERWPERRLRILLAILLALAAVLLPLQIWAVRVVRTALHVGYGEYVPFDSMLAGLAVILAPGCLVIGIVFPVACRLAGRQSDYAVSRVYTAESLGSMVAGAAFSFALVWIMSPMAVAILAGVFVLLGACLLSARRLFRWIVRLMALALGAIACCPVCLAPLERASDEARWRSFGALPSSAASFNSRLLVSCDSRYQNLALIETEGQMTLHANGQVQAVFPDAVTGEHKIHFIMAQNPKAGRVLLIGGNPVNDIPELLKYPLAQLVHVELDDKIDRLLVTASTPAYRQALRDPRLVQVHMDAPRYVKQYGRSGGALRFDAILVDASEPSTIALNRFYMREFYRDIRGILAPDGFLYTAVEATEDLTGETAWLSASIRAAMQSVFDRVLVTAGVKNQFFAGATNCPITLERETLFRRSAGAGIKTGYFRPEYFLNADEISPDKLVFVERRLAGIPADANTVLKPVSTFYQLALWSRFSGSGLESLSARLKCLRPIWLVLAGLGFGAVCLGLGALLGACKPGYGAGPAAFSRLMLALVMTATGLCGMALEMILIFMFQALLGYVYSKIGLIVAMFMLGLALGAFVAPRFVRPGARMQWRATMAIELLLIAELGCIPGLIAGLVSGPMVWIPWGWLEALIYGLIVVCGILVGAQFALINELLGAIRPRKAEAFPVERPGGKTAAITNAADLVGAALGGLFVGVLCLPLFGIAATCVLLAALKVSSLLCLLAVFYIARRGTCLA